MEHRSERLQRNQANPAYVSTGHLPTPSRVQMLVDEAYARFKDNDEGTNAQHYPALARAPRHTFGLCVADVAGACYTAGDADHPFTLMSVCKPFTFALVCQALGAEEVRAKVGLNATGLPFNSVMAIELNAQRLTNPMVNSGALAVASLAPGATLAAKWEFIHEGLSRFAGRRLELDEETYLSATGSNHRNRAISRLLHDYRRLYFDPAETTDLYTRQCCLNASARDLAIMAATLADGGVNPITRERVVDAVHCDHALVVMATAGMYETSGDWLFDLGVPGKSGVSGGVIAVAPGKGALGAFAPPLDAAGNSVRGQLAARFLSNQLGMNLFASKPAIQRAAATPS
jgi:glutaminase